MYSIHILCTASDMVLNLLDITHPAWIKAMWDYWKQLFADVRPCQKTGVCYSSGIPSFKGNNSIKSKNYFFKQMLGLFPFHEGKTMLLLLSTFYVSTKLFALANNYLLIDSTYLILYHVIHLIIVYPLRERLRETTTDHV
jgi:hypothetical protein